MCGIKELRNLHNLSGLLGIQYDFLEVFFKKKIVSCKRL